MGLIDAKTSSKGQVTIPAEIRKRIGLDVGGMMQFRIDEDGQVTIAAKNRSIKGLVGLVGHSGKPKDVKAGIAAAVKRRNAKANQS